MRLTACATRALFTIDRRRVETCRALTTTTHIDPRREQIQCHHRCLHTVLYTRHDAILLSVTWLKHSWGRAANCWSLSRPVFFSSLKKNRTFLIFCGEVATERKKQDWSSNRSFKGSENHVATTTNHRLLRRFRSRIQGVRTPPGACLLVTSLSAFFVYVEAILDSFSGILSLELHSLNRFWVLFALHVIINVPSFKSS